MTDNVWVIEQVPWPLWLALSLALLLAGHALGYRIRALPAACAFFVVDGTRFDAHCWRVCAECLYAGLHWDGDRAVAERVYAAFGAMAWGEWQLVEGLRPGYGR